MVSNSSNKPLTDLQENQGGEIVKFSDEVMACRMMSMGILPGSYIYVLKKSPMNGGICLRIDNNKVALRSNEANSILIKG